MSRWGILSILVKRIERHTAQAPPKRQALRDLWAVRAIPPFDIQLFIILRFGFQVLGFRVQSSPFRVQRSGLPQPWTLNLWTPNLELQLLNIEPLTVNPYKFSIRVINLFFLLGIIIVYSCNLLCYRVQTSNAYIKVWTGVGIASPHIISCNSLIGYAWNLPILFARIVDLSFFKIFKERCLFNEEWDLTCGRQGYFIVGTA